MFVAEIERGKHGVVIMQLKTVQYWHSPITSATATFNAGTSYLFKRQLTLIFNLIVLSLYGNSEYLTSRLVKKTKLIL